MIYKCLKCERVYNEKQLEIERILKASRRIIHFQYKCPICKINQFELQKEVYYKD